MPRIFQGDVQNRLLRVLPSFDFEELSPFLERVPLSLKTPLTELDRPIDHLHFIESGIASVVVTSGDEDDEEEVEVGHIGLEGVTGTPVCLGVPLGGTRTFIQIAGSAFRIRSDDLVRIIGSNPVIRSLLLRYVYSLQMQLAHSTLANARYSLRECLARWLLMSQDRVGENDLPLTHEFLSLMLGVRRAGVTDELHILEGLHVVRATRGNIRVLDRDRLLEIAGGCYGAPERLYDRVIGRMST